MEESKTIARLESENRPEKDYQVEETEKDKVAMMCWENSEGSLVEKANKETDNKKEELTMRCKNQKMKKNMLILHYIQVID